LRFPLFHALILFVIERYTPAHMQAHIFTLSA